MLRVFKNFFLKALQTIVLLLLSFVMTMLIILIVSMTYGGIKELLKVI